MKKLKSLVTISLLQASGLVGYISLVAIIFWKGNEWFGKMGNTYLGPLTVLSLFAVSALICALITLGYPFTLWQKGKGKDALKVVIYTALWVVGFILLFLLSQVIFV